MEAPEARLPASTATEKCTVSDEVELDHHADPVNLSNESRGVKRPAEDELDDDNENEDDNQTPGDGDTSQPVGASGEEVQMSKSQMKKLMRRQKWEEGKEGRRLKRKDKRHERQARKRVRREEEEAAAVAEGRESTLNSGNRPQPRTRVPVSIIIDCQFEKYMQEGELISLSSQVTRCYSDNKGARHPVHLYISSYDGFLKERYETVLRNQHLKWKGVRLSDSDFVEIAKQAKEDMAGEKGGEMIDLLKQNSSEDSVSITASAPTNSKYAKLAPTPEPEVDDVDKSIVYLTADSPYTLERLEPNTSYVIGGIIDKNREKGLCYRIARERKVRTAKLPIGEYMVLQHRHILATNHVVEIMLKWLETGDWGTAFMQVIPTRKGGKLRTDEETPIETTEGEAAKEPEDAQAEDDGQQVDAPQLEVQENPTTQNGNDSVEVEGDNAGEGLTKNSFDESRWSAPPLELETTKEEETPAGGTIAG